MQIILKVSVLNKKAEEVVSATMYRCRIYGLGGDNWSVGWHNLELNFQNIKHTIQITCKKWLVFVLNVLESEPFNKIKFDQQNKDKQGWDNKQLPTNLIIVKNTKKY